MSESAVISVEVKLDPQLDNIKKQIIDKLQKPMVQTALVIEKAMTDAFSAVTRSAEDAGKAVAKAVARIILSRQCGIVYDEKYRFRYLKAEVGIFKDL